MANKTRKFQIIFIFWNGQEAVKGIVPGWEALKGIVPRARVKLATSLRRLPVAYEAYQHDFFKVKQGGNSSHKLHFIGCLSTTEEDCFL